jgi:hypothetical protein
MTKYKITYGGGCRKNNEMHFKLLKICPQAQNKLILPAALYSKRRLLHL